MEERRSIGVVELTSEFGSWRMVSRSKLAVWVGTLPVSNAGTLPTSVSMHLLNTGDGDGGSIRDVHICNRRDHSPGR